MTDPEGGLRDRLIFDSYAKMMLAALTDLGWLTSQPSRRDVTFRTEPAGDDEILVPNVVQVLAEDDTSVDAELGSTLTDDTAIIWVDVFGENDAIAAHLSGDIRAIAQGKYASIGRTEPYFDVQDWTTDGNPVLFTCQIEGVHRIHNTRTNAPSKPWERYWKAVAAEIVYSTP